MSQEQRVFYLHEDDWGMVSLHPYENLTFLHEERDRIDTFSAAHFDGVAWTDIYIRSEEPHPITIRTIPYMHLVELFGSLLPVAETVETGYSSYREPCRSCFAFGKSYDLALYGSSLEIGDGLWSSEEIAWSVDSQRVTIGLRRYPGDAPGLVIDLCPDQQIVIPHAPTETKSLLFAELNPFLERYYAQHRQARS